MSGHSKWSTIKAKKEKTDMKRAKIFTKIGRELAVVVKQGGADPASNAKLRDVIAKAKASNVPSDNIERIIKKASGEDGTTTYEELIYEGYGPSGVACVVETLTDSRNRTAGDMRHYFDKCGGNLGQSGSVMFMFDRKGVIVLDDEDGEKEYDEEAVMMDALDAGAEDLNSEDGIFEIVTDPADFGAVSEALSAKGYKFASAEIAYLPQTYATIDDEESRVKMEKLIDMMEDNDDVQAFWHNWQAPDED